MQNKPAQVAYMSHLSAGDSRSDSAYQSKVHLEVEWVGLVTSGLGFCWRRRLYWHFNSWFGATPHQHYGCDCCE